MRSLAEAGSDRLLPVLLDVTDQDQIEAAAGRVAEDTDGAGLDGLVNNAGIAVPGPLETLPIEDFRRQLDVNLTAQVAVTKAMLPSIRAARGRIVFITSIGGLMAIQMFGAYHAAKFGLEAVGDVFRQELAPWGIQVSIIEPGSIATPIWERGVGEADALLERATEEEKALYPKYIAKYQEVARGRRGAGDPSREGRGDDRARADVSPPSDPLPGRPRRPGPGPAGPLPARPARRPPDLAASPVSRRVSRRRRAPRARPLIVAADIRQPVDPVISSASSSASATPPWPAAARAFACALRASGSDHSSRYRRARLHRGVRDREGILGPADSQQRFGVDPFPPDRASHPHPASPRGRSVRRSRSTRGRTPRHPPPAGRRPGWRSRRCARRRRPAAPSTRGRGGRGPVPPRRLPGPRGAGRGCS